MKKGALGAFNVHSNACVSFRSEGERRSSTNPARWRMICSGVWGLLVSLSLGCLWWKARQSVDAQRYVWGTPFACRKLRRRFDVVVVDDDVVVDESFSAVSLILLEMVADCRDVKSGNCNDEERSKGYLAVGLEVRLGLYGSD